MHVCSHDLAINTEIYSKVCMRICMHYVQYAQELWGVEINTCDVSLEVRGMGVQNSRAQ